ncbi:MAG: subclass B1 metallo-beta-lactamase [Mariniphaga sp.]
MKRILFVLANVVTSLLASAQVFTVNDDIQLVHLKDSVFMHISWHHDEVYGRFSSNGMILIRSGRALMVDTPVDNEKTAVLVTWLNDSLSARVSLVIPGHFHNDCLGGLGYLQDNEVKSLANSQTVARCRELHLPVPAESFTGSKAFDFYGEKVECRYFGPGHSFDNIVVWIPGKKILFGGCLIKSIGSAGLGNLSDAVVDKWDTTVRKLSGYYEDIHTVVPGHGEAGGPELLEHTIRLVLEHKAGIMK